MTATQTATQTATPTKINNLQALRAFAAVAVVFFHTGYIYPNLFGVGEYGVDIFFVLSGYIMARICEKNPRFFLRRRLIRILPPYWTLTILLFLFAIKFPQLLSNTRAHFGELLKSLLFIPFIKDGGLIRPILFVGWSLNYEMFFYLLIAVSLLLWPRRAIVLASAAVIAAHYAAMLFTHGAYPQFLRADFMLEFPLGALAYYAARHIASPLARRIRWGSALLLAACLTSLTLLQLVRPHINFTLQGWLYNIFAMLIVFSTSLLSQGGWDTRVTWVILIGDASYVLYLVHPYCEYFLARVVVPHVPFLQINQPFGCTVAVCLSIAVGLLLHLYAERPVLAYLNQRFGGHRKSAEFGVVRENRGTVQP